LIKIVDRLIQKQNRIIKRFLLLNLIQISGEATLENIEELALLRKELYKVIENERQ
jgi:hypothetical protein